jgi:Ran GTPase-activating protein (RanGAP) involved in mRNA processing and transport
MRKKKKQKLKEEKFWELFFHINIPPHINEVPAHMRRVNFRIEGVSDEELLFMLEYVKSIDMLDLDESEITNLGIQYLTQLDVLKELRLKSCKEINDGCIEYLCQIKSLELLHLGSTNITLEGWSQLSCLQNLKTLLISADSVEDINDSLVKLSAELPNCEIIVNHKVFEL